MNSAQIFRIATRSSELALRQARMVADLLQSTGLRSELVTYKTTGDRNLAQPLSEIGAKGLFTKELEDDLARGLVHCCVHSLKDLPTAMPEGLELGALLPREDPRDVLIVNQHVGASTIAGLPEGSTVGTSSLRRRAQLLALRDDLEVVELRGNVPTRIRKVDDGQVQAAILAAAGLHRLDVAQRISSYLDAPAWLPAAGQGAIAVQVRSDDPESKRAIAALNDSKTEIATRAERAFLAALEGGCQVPIGSLAMGNELFGFISEVDGRRALRGRVALDSTNPEASGISLAATLREQGASEILAGFQRVHDAPSPQPE
ncbi:MAG: hydroxymethylbilane synthase [Gemmatimonadaceae bacterium]